MTAQQVPAEPTLVEYLDSFDEISQDLELVTPGDNDHGEDPTPRFRIMSERAAVWAMRKLATKQAAIAEHNATADAEIERINQWRDTVNDALRGDVQFFEFMLTEWHASRIEDAFGANPMHGPVNPEKWAKFKGKTSKLPNGEIAARIHTGQFSTTDPENAIRFLDEIGRGDLVKRSPVISGTLLDAAIESGGGVMLVDTDYYVHVADDVLKDNEFATALDEAIEVEHTEPQALIDTCLDKLVNAYEWRDHTIRFRVTQELGRHAQCETWVRIPDVHKIGTGVVTIKPKPAAS